MPRCDIKFGHIDKDGLQLSYPRDYDFVYLNLTFVKIPKLAYDALVSTYGLEETISHHNKIMTVVDNVESFYAYNVGGFRDAYMALYQHDFTYYLVYISEKEED